MNFRAFVIEAGLFGGPNLWPAHPPTTTRTDAKDPYLHDPVPSGAAMPASKGAAPSMAVPPSGPQGTPRRMKKK